MRTCDCDVGFADAMRAVFFTDARARGEAIAFITVSRIYYSLARHYENGASPRLASANSPRPRGYIGQRRRTPLGIACSFGLDKVAVVLLEGGANINFATPRPRRGTFGASFTPRPGFTALMYAVQRNHAGVAMLLLKRGADGTMATTERSEAYEVTHSSSTSRETIPAVDAGSTALDIARTLADGTADFAETFAVLRMRCCSTCGMTSPGLAAKTAGEEKHLKRCGNCPARGPRARYCGEKCQRADWVSRHRGECAEARRARQAAGTEPECAGERRHSLDAHV